MLYINNSTMNYREKHVGVKTWVLALNMHRQRHVLLMHSWFPDVMSISLELRRIASPFFFILLVMLMLQSRRQRPMKRLSQTKPSLRYSKLPQYALQHLAPQLIHPKQVFWGQVDHSSDKRDVVWASWEVEQAQAALTSSGSPLTSKLIVLVQ